MALREQRPLVTCAPAALLVVLLVALVFVGWRLVAPRFREVYDPEAVPRLVEARGDLASDEKSTIELFKRSSPSVVHIATWTQRRDYFSRRALEVPRGTGSGFIWDERGYVVTNYHVIDGTRWLVMLDDQSQFEADLVGYEEDFDIAVLKIDAPKSKLRPLAIGSSSDLLVGQKVFAIGNPFGLDHTLSTGIISGLNREILAPNGRAIRDVVQTDAAINPGNSGGPLLDSAGRLIGMNTAIASPSGASAGVGFAVPVDTINRVVPSLVRKGRFERPALGIRGVASQGQRFGVDGVVVSEVLPSSPAEKAGLRSSEQGTGSAPRADVITTVAGQPVRTVEEIWEILGDYKPGDVVEVEFVRNGATQKVSVTLQGS